MRARRSAATLKLEQQLVGKAVEKKSDNFLFIFLQRIRQGRASRLGARRFEASVLAKKKTLPTNESYKSHSRKSPSLTPCLTPAVPSSCIPSRALARIFQQRSGRAGQDGEATERGQDLECGGPSPRTQACGGGAGRRRAARFSAAAPVRRKTRATDRQRRVG